ncbi:hypothetical protein JRO89_XS04G0248800 [Xanthoceras sorbifolium]|uniref:Uncharacterized protein n=1 Tax=Xanthoceras sorbifolium TaxID=99658 RepID=A0ABQ8I6X6_9ROSI|nr:hypothetical protein JRO89_XS04G0248800 [Xanthoceras sorbifolium]
MESFISDAVDYKGNTADRTRTGGWVAAALILGIEVCERMATMGVVANVVTYVVGTMHVPSATASNVTTNFGGTSYLLCLLGGIVSDTWLGRYWTIVIFAIISALGTCMLAICTALPQLRPPPCQASLSNKCEEANNFQMGVFYLALYVYGIGVGGIKSSISGLGTDQFDQKDDKEKAQMVYFFDRFYFIINIGALLGVTVLVWIQDQRGRTWGYGISLAAMIVALVAFLSGTKRYRYKKCVGSPVFQILQVLVAALRKRNVPFPSSVTSLYEDYTQEARISHTNKYSCLDKASIITEEDEKGSSTPNRWRLCTITRVEEVKMLIGLIPIWATTIMFWTVYAQMVGFAVLQATTMDRNLRNFEIPPGSFIVFLIGAIMVTLVIYDRLFMPLFKKSKRKQGILFNYVLFDKFTKNRNRSLLLHTRNGSCSTRGNKKIKYCQSQEGNQHNSSNKCIFLVASIRLGVGIGNAFIYAGQLDFFITQSPKGMKAIGTGLFLTTLSLGFFVSSTLVTIIKKVARGNGRQNWLPRSINNGILDYFYWLLAVLSLINLGFFLLCAMKYKPNSGENAENRQVDVHIPPNKEDST